ncbi:hypothetical protein DQ04_01221170 [Trypanosoma grayi]|uniref:hypothetical protein n=1 Tax=Trypanosoma grayi TaxID=71804 RepID=UPI0004F453B0|nr:hypothetical protein DQ04_01221170 [Trypanosoma grayi]KEG13100.1 hypothetical protein DQ04_01221170 [Trypanosoma grayi]
MRLRLKAVRRIGVLSVVRGWGRDSGPERGQRVARRGVRGRAAVPSFVKTAHSDQPLIRRAFRPGPRIPRSPALGRSLPPAPSIVGRLKPWPGRCPPAFLRWAC